MKELKMPIMKDIFDEKCMRLIEQIDKSADKKEQAKLRIELEKFKAEYYSRLLIFESADVTPQRKILEDELQHAVNNAFDAVDAYLDLVE